MQPNLHSWDRVLRISLGACLLTLAFFSPGELWYLFGLLPLFTGMVGLCPVYKMLKFSTRKV